MDAVHQKRGFASAHTRLQESNLARISPEGGQTWMFGMRIKHLPCMILTPGIVPLT